MQMQATMQRSMVLSRASTIILAILVVVAAWSLNPTNPEWLVLTSVIFLFLYGLKRPLWAMAALLISQLTLTSYMVETPIGNAISLRLLLLIFLGLILWALPDQGRMQLGPQARRVIKPMIILIALATISNIIFAGFDYTFRDFRNWIVGLLTVLFIVAVVRNQRDLKTLGSVVLIGVMASATIGIMQHYNIMGMGERTLLPEFLAAQQASEGGIRVPGIAETELEFSYVMVAAFAVLLGLYITKGVASGRRHLLLISIVLLVVATYFTYTRSALFALVMGIVALAAFWKIRWRGGVTMVGLTIMIVVIALSGILEGSYLGGRSEGVQEESSVSRKILWQAGYQIALDNPVFGIGGGRFTEVSPQYASHVDQSLIDWENEKYWGYGSLGSEAIHNDFLRIWSSYGTFALIAYVWIFAAVAGILVESYRSSSSRFLKGLALGLAVALVVYATNAFYHNLLQTLPLFWIIVGFSLAVAKLVAEKRSQKKQVSQIQT